MTLRLGSLCSGYGGLDMAIASVLNVEPTWVADPDPGATAVLARHHPDIPNLGDITTVDWAAVEPVDVLAAGFPCQDVSLAGLRAGISKGTRTGVWAEIATAIGYLRPRMVVVENVRGLLALLPMEEPDDRCVCGWPHGWGGLHHDCPSAGNIHGSRGHRDDDPSQVGPGVDAVDLWRGDPSFPAGDGTMGRGDLLAPLRFGSSAVSQTNQPASQDQSGSGVGSSEGRGDQDLSGAIRQRAPLDTGGSGALLDSSEEGQGAESKRADLPGANGNADSDCPACGRPVGDGSGRSVLRSGLEVVLRDLARLGFDASWQIVRASDVGAPHQRERVFVLAVAQDADGAARDQWRIAAPGQAESGRARANARGRDRTPAPDAERDRRAGGSSEGPGDADTSREGSWPEVAGRGPRPAADTARDGRQQGRPESAQIVGRFDAALGGGPDVDWGAYGPAIERWARVLGRPAPHPTEPGRNGQPRLNPIFVEWLMGLPAGHVTAVPGLSRAQQLRLLGNGVVPQQGAAAIRALLGRADLLREAA